MMLEVQFNRGLAVTAERVQAVLFDEGLRWFVQTNAPGDTFDDVPTMTRMADLFVRAMSSVLVPAEATVVRITVLRDRLTFLGAFVLTARDGGCFMWAENRVRWRSERSPLGDTTVAVTEAVSNDLQAIAPVWERVVAELRGLGLVVDPGSEDAGPGDEKLSELDSRIVAMWRDGYTDAEIGDKFSLAPRTIQNKVSMARKNIGKDKVPYHRKP